MAIYTKDSLDFSTKVNGIHFHIRASKPSPLRNEIIQQSPHMHYTWEFHYLFEGEAEMKSETNGKVTLLYPKKEQICIVPPETVHTFQTKSVTRFCFNMIMEFDAKDSDNKISDFYRLHSVFSAIDRSKVMEDRYITALMNQFREIYEDSFFYPNMHKGFLLVGVVMRIFDILYPSSTSFFKHNKEELSSVKNPMDRKWIIKEHIAESYTDEGGLSALAKKLYLSERQTRVIVYELMGENYKKLITRQRMSIASALISSPSTSLSDIAYKIGYHSYNGFYIAYTKFYGVTPEEARKQVLEKQATRGELDRKIYVEKPMAEFIPREEQTAETEPKED